MVNRPGTLSHLVNMVSLRKWSMFRRRSVVSTTAEVLVDVPNDSPSNVAQVLSTLSHIMKSAGVSWCVLGDLLLAHYLVPQDTGVRLDPVSTRFGNSNVLYPVAYRNLRTIRESQRARITP